MMSSQDGAAGPPWWKSGILYQVYPWSFSDADGDGIGDLDGIIGRLDYVAGLGVDAIWLSPIFRSPMADFGYDIAEYCEIDVLFGSNADADRLVAEAHRRRLRVIFDLVPNHTSDEHVWFVDARAGATPATEIGTCGGIPAPMAVHRTTGRVTSADRRGSGTRRANSSTCTSSTRSSRT